MENQILELCKKVINGGVPYENCHNIGCEDCPFKDEKIECGTTSTEAFEIAQNYICEIARNYIKEHEKAVDTVEKIEENNMDETYEFDEAVNPKHYQDKELQPIKVIHAWQLNFNLGSVIKYIGRLGEKDDPIQELEKCLWYIKDEINERQKMERRRKGQHAEIQPKKTN